MNKYVKFFLGLALLVGAFALFIKADDSNTKTAEYATYGGSLVLAIGAGLVWFKVKGTPEA